MSDALAVLLDAAGVRAGRGDLVEARSLGGGCIAEVRRCGFANGDSLVAKVGPSGRAAEEAAGLRAIAATATIPVPEVVAEVTVGNRSLLVIEDLGDASPAGPAAWSSFGESLADLHAASCRPSFGFEGDHHLGDTPECNAPASRPDSWAAFLGERRLRPMAEALDARGLLEGADRGALESLAGGLEDRLPSDIAAGLVHGDLWSGNVHPTADRGIAVIDPAAFRADPLFELGMMRLFGGFPSACEAAYLRRFTEHRGREATQAAELRIELGRLHHVLNHWLLFGGAYAAQARRLLADLSRASPRSRP